MVGRLAARSCVITGSSSGLGRAIALQLAKEGANIICADLAPTARAVLPGEDTRATHELIAELGRKAKFIRCDITSPSDWEALVLTATEEFGRLDV